MILEGIVTTLSADGVVNIAPMGPQVPDDPEGDPLQQLTLKPFRTSQTFRNLQAHPEGVFHITDDVLLLAQAAIGTPSPLPELLPAKKVRGFVLRNACRYAEFRVRSLTEGERALIEVDIVHLGRQRDFFGFHRARHAVLEAAILATRCHLLALDFLESEFARLGVLVEKTGGPREFQAFALLQDHLAQIRRHQLAESPPP